MEIFVYIIEDISLMNLSLKMIYKDLNSYILTSSYLLL